MSCIVCKGAIAIWRLEKDHIIKYCGETCRSKYYHDLKSKEEIVMAIKENDQEYLRKFTVKRLRRLGFNVLISELLIENQ